MCEYPFYPTSFIEETVLFSLCVLVPWLKISLYFICLATHLRNLSLFQGQKLFTCIFFYRILNITFYIYLFSLFGTYFCLWCEVGISFSFYLHNHFSSTVYWISFLIINTATLVTYPLPYYIHGSASGLFFPSLMCLSLPHCLHFYSFMTILDIWLAKSLSKIFLVVVLHVLGPLILDINFRISVSSLTKTRTMLGFFIELH